MFTFLRNQLILILFCLSVTYAQNNAGDVVHQFSITQNLKAPVRFAIDASDNIYVTDDFHKSILKYDANGNFINSILVGISPLSIAISNSGQMFVGDGESGKIYKVESDGTSSEFYNGCYFPSSMTFSPEGMLYVADGILKKVLVLDVSANIVQTIGTGTLIFPSEVVYDKRNSRVLVSEHGGVGTGMTPACKIWIFNLAGVLQGSFASAGNGDGQFYRIQGMTVGKCGNLYVCDPFQGNISVFNESNVFITRFGQFGNLTAEMNVPMDILFDSQERVIVASMNNGVLDVYNVSDTLPTSNIANSDAVICSGQTANITIDFTGTAPWTFTYTVDGINPTVVTTSDNPYVLSVNSGGLYEITALSDLNKTGTCFSGSAEITVNSAIPVSNMTTVNATVCSGNAVDIPVQFTGTSPWTFTYTQNGINPVSVTTANNPYLLSVTEAGLYEVTAISGGGCTGNTFTGSTNVTLSTLPTAAFTAGNSVIPICQGEAVTLPIEFTGISPWTFTYTVNNANPLTFVSAENTFLLTTSEAGIYNITVISDTYCSNNVTQGVPEVVVKPIPSSVMASVNTGICSGNVAEIPITFTGNPPFTFTYTVNDTVFYEVSTYENQFNLQAGDAGVYQIIDLNGDGCNSSDNTGNAVISVNPLPVVSLGADSAICANQSVTLDPGIYSSYLWFDSGTNQTAVVNTTGAYAVTVTDANGCSNYDEMILTVNPLPALNLGPDAGICENQILTIDPGTFNSYLWNDLSVNQTLQVSSAGTYSVTVTDANNCVNADTITINVNTLPVIDLGADVTICENQSYLIDAGVYNSYLWNDMSTGQTLIVNLPGIYSVTVTDASGCENTDNLVLNVNLLPVIDLGPDLGICQNQSLILDAGVFSGYLWSDMSTNQTFQVNAPGTYSITVTDINNCQNSDAVVVSANLQAIPQFTHINSGLQTTFTNNSQNAISYLWDFGDGQTSTIVNPVHSYVVPAVYTVILTASNGLCADSSMSQIVDLLGVSIGGNGNAGYSINVFPNPSDGNITVTLSGKNQNTWMVEITNSVGQIIYSCNYNHSTENIDLSRFASGIYSIKIISSEISRTEKLIINK